MALGVDLAVLLLGVGGGGLAPGCLVAQLLQGRFSASSNSSSSQVGSACAASVMAAACWGESLPWRAAASVFGWAPRRLAFSSSWAAWDTGVPVRRPSMWAGLLSPPRPHSSVWARRVAARALVVAAMCSMRAARSITPSAWAPDSRAGSKPEAKVAIAFSSSPSLTHMCAPPPALTDRPTGKCNCQSPFSQGGVTGIARARNGDSALEPECIATLRPLNIRQYGRHGQRP